MGSFIKGTENNTGTFMRIKNILFLMLVGVILNITGAFIAYSCNLDLYLDTTGTILVSAISGYLPGILTGFLTNMLKVVFKSSEMYYCAVNMFIAVVVAFTVKKGFFKSKLKAIVVAILVVLISGFLSSDITCFLEYSDYFDIDNVPFQIIKDRNNPFFLRYIETLKTEVVDKGITVFLAFLMYTLLPYKQKIKFKIIGLWQAKLEPAIWKEIKKQTTRRHSIKVKMVEIFIIGGILISASATIISLVLFKESTINEHINAADGVISLIEYEIDKSMIDEYIKDGFRADGYAEIRENLDKIKNSYQDIEYLYLYKITEEGCVVIFDLDATNLDASAPGEIVEFDTALNRYKTELLNGEKIPPIISDDIYGYLLTIIKPVYNSEGECVCHIGVDFSMNVLNEYVFIFLMREISLLIGFFIMTVAIGLTYIEHNIIIPVNTMSYFVRTFAYDTEEERKRNIDRLRGIDIRTGDEIENLYHAFLKTTEDSMLYSENLMKARIIVENMKEKVQIMDEIAYKDALTGVKNKVAYYEYTNILDKYIIGANVNSPIDEDSDIFRNVYDTFINNKEKKFALIMIDLNFLKRVNDNYGHKCGDIYIESCTNLLKDVFDNSNIFRVGGDEFVILINSDDIKHCEELIRVFSKECEKLKKDKKLNPWEQVSAAIGIAYYDEQRDKNCEDVFKRADLLMYKNKIKVKKKRHN